MRPITEAGRKRREAKEKKVKAELPKWKKKMLKSEVIYVFTKIPYAIAKHSEIQEDMLETFGYRVKNRLQFLEMRKLGAEFLWNDKIRQYKEKNLDKEAAKKKRAAAKKEKLQEALRKLEEELQNLTD